MWAVPLKYLFVIPRERTLFSFVRWNVFKSIRKSIELFHKSIIYALYFYDALRCVKILWCNRVRRENAN